jgi:sugar phosphate isomerase/epimerase
MEIGFLTWYLKQTSLDDSLSWAAESGFSGLELDNCPDDPTEVRELLTRYPEVRIHALGRALNYLTGTADDRAACAALLSRDIEIAAEVGIGVINIFAGRNPRKTIDENLVIFKEVFTPLVAKAETLGVKLAMENCAQRGWWPTGGNLAHTPENWRKLFEVIPSPALGLTFDPSHFIFQHMDYLAAVHEFGARIYYVHAKDCEILTPLLADRGIYGNGWWRWRLPGWGLMDWAAFFTALREVGYTGAVGIEHEDPLWNHDDDEIRQGLCLARDFLSQFEI